MPSLPKKKIGLISCSGEELAEGTLARLATLSVLEQLRPDDTVTLCLPLFLAGDDKERAFAKFFPTVAIDGCDKRCAARATAQYGAPPAASIVIPQFLAKHGLEAPRARSQEVYGPAERTRLALAEEIASRVDEILGTRATSEPRRESESETATCSCGSGVPVMRLEIAGKLTEIVALPLIFEQFLAAHKSADGLLEAVKVYNAVPPELETAYRDAIGRAYAAYRNAEEAGR